MLAILFGASSLSGLLYGRIRWTGALTYRFRILTICLTASLLPLTLAHSVTAMAILVTLPGLAFGPALISAFLLAQQSSAADQQNQANAWVSTANTGGAALGLAVGGLATANAGLTVTLLSPAILAAAGSLVTMRRRRTVTTDAPPSPDMTSAAPHPNEGPSSAS